MNLYWTFIRDGKTYDAEFETKEDALLRALQLFTEECLDAGGGEHNVIEDDIELVCLSVDDDGNEMELSREPAVVRYDFRG